MKIPEFILFIEKNVYRLAVSVVVILFVLFKVSHLSLPYYWDEAWVYGTAIHMMEAKGLSLMPDSLPVYFTRGHPLLFHFLGAAWMRVFGSSISASHFFPLCVSVLLIGLLFLFGKNIFKSEKTGFIASYALVFQPIFLAQSGLLLPEVLLTFFSLLALYFYLQEKYIPYVVAATLAVFTKESGIMLIATLLVWTLIDFFRSDDSRKLKKSLLRSLLIAVPLVPFMIFLVIQRLSNGWFVFPDHLQYVSFSPPILLDKLERYSAYLFIYQGRNLLTFSAIVAFSVLAIRKWPVESKMGKAIFILLIHGVLFIVFGSLNFYSDRYMMFAIPALMLLFSYGVCTAFKYKWIPLLIVLVVPLVQLHFIHKLSSSDHNLGYIDAVKTHQKAVDYCVANKLQDKKIYASFLMQGNLTNPYVGYLAVDQRFNHITGDIKSNPEYWVFSDVEDKNNYVQLKDSLKLRVLARFESHQAWTEICKKEN